MSPAFPPVTGPQLLEYLKQSCVLLESTSAEARDCFTSLPEDLQRRIAANLQIVQVVTRYLERSVLPSLVRNGEVRYLLSHPDTVLVLDRILKRVKDLSERLNEAVYCLN